MRHAGEPGHAGISRPAPAFTMVELLVVIVIIILLTGLIAGVATKAIENQRITVTKNTMRTIDLAIQQFVADSPLGTYYNNRRTNSVSFGSFPAYQLDSDDNPNHVGWAVEPNPPPSLKVRLVRDLTPLNSNNVLAEIKIQKDSFDDIRSLYTYLRVFSPAGLSQVPDTASKPLRPKQAEWVDVTGGTSSEGDNARAEVLGFYDAWGVPLDYFLHVRLEWGLVPSPTPGLPPVPGLLVRDRVPVLRSHGVSSEIFDEYVRTGVSSVLDAKKAIYSQPFPSPKANVDPDTGLFSGGTSGNGWARAKAAGKKDYYKYIPQ